MSSRGELCPAQAAGEMATSVKSPHPKSAQAETTLWHWPCFKSKVLTALLQLRDLEQRREDHQSPCHPYVVISVRG